MTLARDKRTQSPRPIHHAFFKIFIGSKKAPFSRRYVRKSSLAALASPGRLASRSLYIHRRHPLATRALAIRYFVLPHGHRIDHSEERIGIARRRLRVPAMPEKQSRAMAPGAGTVAKYRLPTAGYMFGVDVEIEMLEIAAPLE